MITKLDIIRNQVQLAQKVFDRFPNKTGITIVSKILNRILKTIDE